MNAGYLTMDKAGGITMPTLWALEGVWHWLNSPKSNVYGVDMNGLHVRVMSGNALVATPSTLTCLRLDRITARASPMAWIESHQSLARHRKLLRALHVLRTCDRHKLIGHLHVLWWWGLDSADINGVLGNISPSEIAQAADWGGDADLFFAALLEAGFIDKTEAGYQLHDWYSYAGKLMAQRQLTKEQRRQGGMSRMAQLTPEERQKLARDAAHARWDASAMPAAMPGKLAEMPATVPNPTVPNHSITPSPSKEGVSPDMQSVLLGEDISWLRELRMLPKWPTDKEAALVAWTKAKNLVPDHLERTALALRAKWDGKRWKDPIATFKNWALMPEKGGNGAKSQGDPRSPQGVGAAWTNPPISHPAKDIGAAWTSAGRKP